MFLGLILVSTTGWQAISFSDHVYLHVKEALAVGKAWVLESGRPHLNLTSTTY